MGAIITGMTGLLGRQVAEVLRTAGTAVQSLRARFEPVEPGVVPINVTALTDILRQAAPSYLYHLAGISRAVTAGDFCKINTEYAATLLDALSAAKLHDTTLVLVGSAAEYGPLTEAELPAREDGPIRPADFYGASKLAQTFLGLTAARRGQRVIIARPSNLIGPGMSSDLAIGAFVHQLAAISRGHQERSILVGDLSGSRDFIDVKDAADFIVRLAYNPSAAGQVVNICAGHPTSLSSILETLLNQFERRSPGAVAVKRRQIDSTATSSKVHFSCNRLLLELLGSAEYTPLQATLSRTLDAALTTGNSKPDANIQ